jgi:hypothetical protein
MLQCIYAKADPPTTASGRLKLSQATGKPNDRAIQIYGPSIEHGNEQQQMETCEIRTLYDQPPSRRMKDTKDLKGGGKYHD